MDVNKLHIFVTEESTYSFEILHNKSFFQDLLGLIIAPQKNTLSNITNDSEKQQIKAQSQDASAIERRETQKIKKYWSHYLMHFSTAGWFYCIWAHFYMRTIEEYKTQPIEMLMAGQKVFLFALDHFASAYAITS